MSTTHFYTFGADHHASGGAPLQDKYVAITVPEGWDHRTIFMTWRGGNAFAFEYDAEEFTHYKFVYQPTLFKHITVTETSN